MKKFLKKNPFLTVTTALTLIISIILIYLITETNGDRKIANSALEDLKLKIEKLNNYSPSPTTKNINKIKIDLQYIKAETSKLEEYFGFVYNTALNSFIKALEQPAVSDNGVQKASKLNTQAIETQPKKELAVVNDNNDNNEILNFESKKKFINSWKIFIEKQSKMNNSLEPSQILNKFRISQKYPKDKFTNAKNIFLDVFSKDSIEKIATRNLDDYILAALGLPLGLTRISCKKFIDNIQKTLENKLRKVKLLSISENLVLFNEFTTIPNEDQISYIIKYCRFYEDLFTRIANGNIETLVSYKKSNGLKGTQSGDYLIFKYELKFISSLSSARQFLNNLQSAYKNNRIYIIKDVSLKHISSRADKIQPYTKDSKSSKATNKTTSKSTDKVNNTEVAIQLGTSNLVSINIKFDYVMFVKPLIKI